MDVTQWIKLTTADKKSIYYIMEYISSTIDRNLFAGEHYPLFIHSGLNKLANYALVKFKFLHWNNLQFWKNYNIPNILSITLVFSL